MSKHKERLKRMQRQYIRTLFWPTERLKDGVHVIYPHEIEPDGRSQRKAPRDMVEEGYLTPVPNWGGYQMQPRVYDEIISSPPKLINIWEKQMNGKQAGICHDAVSFERLTTEEQKFIITQLGAGAINYQLYLGHLWGFTHFDIGYPNEFTSRVEIKVDEKCPLHEAVKKAAETASKWRCWSDFNGPGQPADIRTVRDGTEILVSCDSLRSYTKNFLFNRHVSIVMCERLENTLKTLKELDGIEGELEPILIQLGPDPCEWEVNLDSLFRTGMLKLEKLSSFVKLVGDLRKGINEAGGWPMLTDTLRADIINELKAKEMKKGK